MTAQRIDWFGPKRIGWGISPRRWQGWATLLVYCTLMISLTRVIDPVAHQVVDIAIRVAASVAFCAILFLKSDSSKHE
jgi:hypothetical protein